MPSAASPETTRSNLFGDHAAGEAECRATSHDAAAPGVLAGRQDLRQRITAAFAATAYDDAMKAVVGAQKTLADSVAPDDASAALRDRLAPLV